MLEKLGQLKGIDILLSFEKSGCFSQFRLEQFEIRYRETNSFLLNCALSEMLAHLIFGISYFLVLGLFISKIQFENKCQIAEEFFPSFLLDPIEQIKD